jgi:putative sigma-54 modulation protein
MEITVQSVHFDADLKLEEFIEKKLKKLETFFDHIVSADVILKLENSGQVKDKIAEIKLNVPGATLLAKETCKTFEEAIDLCADALRRQLQKHKDKVNGN